MEISLTNMKTHKNMKQNYLMVLIAIVAFSFSLKAAEPEGLLTYSLPSTTISLEVEAVKESFYAGPYAKFAEKYLGITARDQDNVTFNVESVKLTPYVEADNSSRYMLTTLGEQIDPNYLKLSSMGLISLKDGGTGSQTNWRFPTPIQKSFAGQGLTSNLTSEATTLFKKDEEAENFSKVAFQQNMLVQRTLEQKAQEAANKILEFRKQRMQIVTGDTDATYSGEAMSAAIAELHRMENEYLALFIGYSVTQRQKMNFDIVPQKSNDKQIYVAFRLSDTQGLVPAEDVTGKPVVMEISPEPIKEMEAPAKFKVKSKTEFLYYRIPAICKLTLRSGSTLLLQTRVPIYQLGLDSSIPSTLIFK